VPFVSDPVSTRKSSEQGNAQFRRSLYFVKNLRAGEIVTEDAIRSVRPGFGLPPKFIDQVIGCRVNQDVTKHTPVRREALS
jgi:N-acetylneuraminate synthase